MDAHDDMWTPFKHLQTIVDQSLTGQLHLPNTNVAANLEISLRKNKRYFQNLLRNPPKNEKSRQEIRQGITEGVQLPGIGLIHLPKELVDETIILSDMYNLNEYVALELLSTAQEQMPYHPGLPRGLVAILLYYDGRKALVSTLKELFQARLGVAWCCNASPEIQQIVTNFVDQLVVDGILNRIIDLLEQLDITKELEILSENRALGPPKHFRQVLDLFDEIRLQLATSLFCISAQCGLMLDTTKKLIQLLSKYKPNDSRGGIDNINLALLMTLLYTVDLSVLHRRDDEEDTFRALPIISTPGFGQHILDDLNTDWACNELKSIVYFALGLSMATLRQAPTILQQNSLKVIDQDEYLVEQAIGSDLFNFIYHILLENDSVYKMEFYFRRIHCLLTDFIELMHSKLTELRARADETARMIHSHQQQGLEPPTNLCRNFEMLLNVVGKLYGNDKLNLGLNIEYWGPMDIPSNYQKMSARSVSLFKFIRLAGELLPPVLFVPYLNMLAGLSGCQQSARNAYNLLKQGSGVSGSITLSWDHFFNSFSQYYQHLRQEQHPATETVYRSRALNRNINPQEIDGLRAVLRVIRTVAEHDEVARIALCEHSSWAPLQNLLGLISCSVPIQLKADLLITLSALSRSRSTAHQLWINLEASQIIRTIPSTNTNLQYHGIESELEQIECRNELYPLTGALLDFFYSLSVSGVPQNLGAGNRSAGLDPYLTFILDVIFLRFTNRNYKDPTEKWSIAEKCLRIFEHFVNIYDVNPLDFPIPGRVMEKNPPPGFHIMLQMNTNEKSDLLKLILFIINEACNQLDTYTPFPGKENLEKSALKCLKIIERVLTQQDLFFDAHYSANCSILIYGLNKLLLGINSRSGKPDHMLNITKYVTYNSWLPYHSLAAVRILTIVCRQPNVNSLLLGELMRTQNLSQEIRYGFVECLETDIVVGRTVKENTEFDSEPVELCLKEAIIYLLKSCIAQPVPNIAHYLLGFGAMASKDGRPINNRLQYTDSTGQLFQSTCLKSLVTVLDRDLTIKCLDGEQSLGEQRLIENAYKLLYSLCHDTRTSNVVLRFLRSCNDLLCRHVSKLPFTNVQNAAVLNQMTGLLKSVAIELKLTAENDQRSQFGKLCNILLGLPADGTRDTNYDEPPIDTIGLRLESDGQGTGLLISKLFECISFEIKSIDRPKWEYFDNVLMNQLFQNCETTTISGLKLIDIKKLNVILKDELSLVQNNIATSQRQLIVQESEQVLIHALKINDRKAFCAATIKYLEAWGQVTEIMFSVAPTQSITVELKQRLILEILQTILAKIVPSDVMSEISNLTASTVLQLLVSFRHSLIPSVSGLMTGMNFGMAPLIGGKPIAPKANALSLKYILKNIVEWIIISGVSSQKLKINLYAALLNFMHIIQRKQHQSIAHWDNPNQSYVSRLDSSMITIQDPDGMDQTELAVEVFSQVGDKIMDILCHDCTGGHDVCRMLAFSCIDMLLNMNLMTNFIQFISKRGYIAHLVDSLMKTDDELCRILDNVPENLKALFVYESKMAMFGRIARTYIGAELLLEQRILGVLSGMKVYDMHPDFEIQAYNQQRSIASVTNQTSFIPSIEIRYQQILFPAINLCNIFLSTLGPGNHSAIIQIVHFLLSHGDMIEIVLRAGSPTLHVGMLQELACITGLIARTANQELNLWESNQQNQDLGAHLYRLQKLMLGLWSRFILTDSMIQEIYKPRRIIDYNQTEIDKMQCVKYILEIACNLALYARNAIANHSADHRTTGILFSPNVDEVVLRSETKVGNVKSAPHIGIVITQLKKSIEYHNREKGRYDELIQQKNAQTNISLESSEQSNLRSQLQKKLDLKCNELRLCSFLIEHCLYLLWAHLDYYMLRSIPMNAIQLNASFNFTESTLNVASDAAWKVTVDDVMKLKKSLISICTEQFDKDLLATAKDNVRTDQGFIEALLRRIKRLIVEPIK